METDVSAVGLTGAYSPLVRPVPDNHCNVRFCPVRPNEQNGGSHEYE